MRSPSQRKGGEEEEQQQGKRRRFDLNQTAAAAAANSNMSSFFKVFFPQISSQRLLIPNDFVASTSLREKLPEEFIIRNGRGRDWKVKPSCIGNQVYFEHGWKRFVEDNNLQLADFIVFTCDDGSNSFKVKMYEVSGCEKKEVEVEQENDSVMGMEIKEEEEEGEEEDDSYVMDEDEDDEDDYDYDDYDNHDDEEEEEDIVMDEMRNQSHLRGNKAHHVKSKRSIAGCSGSKADEHAIAIAAMYFRHPDNPSFVARKLKHRDNELHIPYNIINDFSLHLPETITLYCQYFDVSSAEQRSVRKSCWTSTGKLYTWKDGRACIKGWAAFCRKNRIDENDRCICEFVLGEDQEIEMLQVHVVRGLSDS